MRSGVGPSFGAGGRPQGIAHDPEEDAIQRGDAGSLLGIIARYLRRIADRYDLPYYEDPRTLNLTASGPGQAAYFQYHNQVINSFTLTVVTGTISVYLGDWSGQTALGTPHFQAGPGATIQIFLNPRPGRTFTVQATGGGAATGTFIPMAV